MNRKFPTIISFFSLLVLVIIQAYIIRSYYNEKSRNFDFLYSKAILGSIETKDFGIATDSLNIMLNEAAFAWIGDVTDSLNPSYRNKIITGVNCILNRYDSNRAKILKYLVSNKLDTSFQTQFHIKEISLLNFDMVIPVYRQNKANEVSSGSKGLYIKSYYTEGDFYAIRYDFNVDFTHKRNIILSEMRGLLVIVVVTIAAVILTFIYTLVTLQRQKKLSELKDDFINNITHEFKTPLSVISVAASSLKQTEVQASPQKISEISMVLDKQNKLLCRMIDNVIDVNLLNRRVANFNKESVLLRPYMAEVIAQFVRNDMSGKNIQINEDYQVPDDFGFLLDSVQFSRVLNNLLGNSVKYCGGNPVITIRVMFEGQLKIEIEDNGIGIKEEHLKDVFNKFFRVDTSPKVKGLGLGLYIVKRIIESHNGTISLQSTFGKGTTATIILPK